jgi:aspartyl/glutamyl-tRNA(Asn/Gln) amidotransferase C subunit
MTKFDKEELLNIANLSSLKLNEQEADVLVNEIKLFLDYTAELNQVTITKEVAPIKNVNVFRKDEVKQNDSSNLLAQAPQTKDNYFVVPKVLKSN